MDGDAVHSNSDRSSAGSISADKVALNSDGRDVVI